MSDNKWRVVATSVRGTSHEKTGQACQDATYFRLLPHGVLVAAVADGAGSAALSDVGASIAAGAAVEAIRHRLATPKVLEHDVALEILLRQCLEVTQKAVEEEAEERGMKVRDLASTLILVVATPELVAATQVGDGVAVVGDAMGNVMALTTPQRGEYVNETIFLIAPDAVSQAQQTIWRGPVGHIAIISDGLQRLALKMPEGTPHGPFFSPLFQFVSNLADEVEGKEQLEAFLNSPRVRERTDDDLTLLLATPLSSSARSTF